MSDWAIALLIVGGVVSLLVAVEWLDDWLTARRIRRPTGRARELRWHEQPFRGPDPDDDPGVEVK